MTAFSFSNASPSCWVDSAAYSWIAPANVARVAKPRLLNFVFGMRAILPETQEGSGTLGSAT
jgi:hypothetical protein